MRKLLYLVVLYLFCYQAQAQAQAEQAALKEKWIVTSCLLNKLNKQATLLAQSEHFRVVEINPTDESMRILKTNPHCGKYLNLQPYLFNKRYKDYTLNQLLAVLTKVKPVPKLRALAIHHETQVKQALSQVDKASLWEQLLHLTHYLNRSANSAHGVEAAHWFKEQMDATAKLYNRQDIETYYVKTGTKFKQASVVTLIGKEKKGEAIVIGAHIDTLDGDMPGADDDASGISVIMELYRVLLASNIAFDNPIYIIAYAAEERGLVGSGYVVKSFLKNKTPVKAVMQFDQAGFRANENDKTIWLIDDYVDQDLTQFIAKLVKHYLNIPIAYSHCGYACSDHASWHLNGFKASYPSATTLDNDNPNVHSSDDRVESLSLEHMEHFVKIGLAFVIELALS